MAKWNVSDELDARLRSYLAGTGRDVKTFVEQLVQNQLDYEDDPEYRTDVLASINRGVDDVKAGRVQDAREAMREIAAEKQIKLNR